MCADCWRRMLTQHSAKTYDAIQRATVERLRTFNAAATEEIIRARLQQVANGGKNKLKT